MIKSNIKIITRQLNPDEFKQIDIPVCATLLSKPLSIEEFKKKIFLS